MDDKLLKGVLLIIGLSFAASFALLILMWLLRTISQPEFKVMRMIIVASAIGIPLGLIIRKIRKP